MFAVYRLMKDQGVYHLMNSYEKELDAKNHLEIMINEKVEAKILQQENPAHNIPIREFEELHEYQTYNNSRPAER